MGVAGKLLDIGGQRAVIGAHELLQDLERLGVQGASGEGSEVHIVQCYF
jgi:hypothetical protein